MRFVFVISLFVFLLACGVSPKDYSNAAILKPIETRLMVQPLWIKPAGSVPEYAHAQLSPTVAGKRIYVAEIGGDVSVLDADSGEQLWSRSLDATLTGGPGVGAGLVFVGSRKAEIIALDQKDGTERWRTRVTSEMLVNPLIAGASLIVQTIDGKLASLDSESGRIIWSYGHNIPKLTLRGTATPIVAGEQIITGFADGKLVSLNINTGEVNWETTITVPRGRTDLERLADIDGLFKASDAVIYVSSYQGRVAAVSTANGNIQWARNMSSYNGLSIGAGQIYISDVAGKVWALDAGTGATLWRQDNLTGRDITVPTVMESAVVVADYDGYVHWLSTADGQIIARQNIGEFWNERHPVYYESLEDELEEKEQHRPVSVPLLALNNILYVRDNVGALAAFKVESKTP